MRLPSPTAAEVGVAAALSSQVVVYLIIESTCVTSRRAFIWTESRSEEHTSELQSQSNLVCRLLLEKKKKKVRPSQSRKSLLTENDYHVRKDSEQFIATLANSLAVKLQHLTTDCHRQQHDQLVVVS